MNDINTPFIHLFETQKNKYVYDVNTNEIIQLSDIAYDFLRFQQSGIAESDIFVLLKSDYDSSIVESTINSLDEIKKNASLFSSVRPTNISMFCCKDNMLYYYQHYINQMIFEVTQRCNLSCKYCVYSGIYQDHRVNKNKDMTWDIAKRGMDFMFLHGGKDLSTKIQDDSPPYPGEQHRCCISFYGGEPLLRLDFLQDCISYCAENAPEKKKISYAISTNATMLTEEIVDYFFKNKVMMLISLDGPAYLHDRMRLYPDGKGTHAHVERAVRMIYDYAKKIKPAEPLTYSVNCVYVGGLNLEELVDYYVSMEDVMYNEYVNASIFMNSMTGGVEKWNESYPDMQLSSPEGLRALFDEYEQACINGVYSKDNSDLDFRSRILHDLVYKSFYFDIHARTRYQYSDEIEIMEMSHPGSLCKIGARRLYLTADGTFLPCERVPSENSAFYIGNVINGFNLDRICHLYDEFVDATIDDCRNCWCYRMCDVGCFNGKYKNGKLDPDLKKEKCEELRARRHGELIDMLTLLEKHPHALDHYNDIAVE